MYIYKKLNNKCRRVSKNICKKNQLIKEIGSVKKSGKKTNMKKPSGKVSKNMAEKTTIEKT